MSDNEVRLLSAARRISHLERALLVAGAHCQGGHSDAGQLIADAFDIPFPLTMGNLKRAAEARGYEPSGLWPWWEDAPRPARTLADVVREAVTRPSPKRGSHD